MFPSKDHDLIGGIETSVHRHLQDTIAEPLVDLSVKKLMKSIKQQLRCSTDDEFYFQLNELLDAYCARHNTDRIKILSEQVFEDQIFGGNCHDDPKRNGTGQSLAVLYYKIDHAISAIGGMQQNGGMGTKYDTEYEKTATAEVERTVRDIAMALAGKRIKFVERLKV